jgi:hypothetical protein
MQKRCTQPNDGAHFLIDKILIEVVNVTTATIFHNRVKIFGEQKRIF